MVEKILDLNQGLAEHGPILPIGLVLQIPIPEDESAATVAAPRVSLW